MRSRKVDNAKGIWSPMLLLLQDCLLSVSASLLSILLVRWISKPIPEYSLIVLKWLGCSLVFSVIAFLLTKSNMVACRWISRRSAYRLSRAVFIKGILIAATVLSGFVRLPSAAYCLVAILSDVLLTGIILIYVRIAARYLSDEETIRIREEASKPNALVAGVGIESVLLSRTITNEGKFNVIGFVSDDKSKDGMVIGDTIVHSLRTEKDLETICWKLGGVDCIFLPKSMSSRKDGADNAGGMTEQESFIRDGMLPVGAFIKRSFDIIMSSLLIIVLSPVAAIIIIAIKAEDGGPAFFRQERIGKGGQAFHIMKFRSMRVDSEKDGARLCSGEDDPRLTGTGRFLRNHHLDELPQLFNVLVGEMSFIGYRPERKCYIDQIVRFNPRYSCLYQIRPGVTSYATLYNGYTDSMEKMLTRLDLDLYYLRNHSVFFDAKVLALTFINIVTGKKI